MNISITWTNNDFELFCALDTKRMIEVLDACSTERFEWALRNMGTGNLIRVVVNSTGRQQRRIFMALPANQQVSLFEFLDNQQRRNLFLSLDFLQRRAAAPLFANAWDAMFPDVSYALWLRIINTNTADEWLNICHQMRGEFHSSKYLSQPASKHSICCLLDREHWWRLLKKMTPEQHVAMALEVPLLWEHAVDSITSHQKNKIYFNLSPLQVKTIEQTKTYANQMQQNLEMAVEHGKMLGRRDMLEQQQTNADYATLDRLVYGMFATIIAIMLISIFFAFT